MPDTLTAEDLAAIFSNNEIVVKQALRKDRTLYEA